MHLQPSIPGKPYKSRLITECALPLGSHDMFLAEIVAVDADEKYFDEKDCFDMNKAGLLSYIHGAYLTQGDVLGTFGYSVRKKPAAGKPAAKKPASKKSATK